MPCCAARTSGILTYVKSNVLRPRILVLSSLVATSLACFGLDVEPRSAPDPLTTVGPTPVVDGGPLPDAGASSSGGPITLTGSGARAAPPVIDLAGGMVFTCALDSAGDVRCFGANRGGALLGIPEDPKWRNAPGPRVSLDGPAKQVVVGERHACALSRSGDVSCWGFSDWGVLGDGGSGYRAAPTRVALDGKAVSIAASTRTTCAALEDGQLRCWGSYEFGSLAGLPSGLNYDVNTGPSVRTLQPRPVSFPGSRPVKKVALGRNFACVQFQDDSVGCFGNGQFGQLGRDIPGMSADPSTDRVIPPGTASDLKLGDDFACVLKKDTGVLCWGAGTAGQLGQGTIENSSAAKQVVTDAAELYVAGKQACAKLKSGNFVCWGSNEFGTMGREDVTAHQLSPTAPTTSFGAIERLRVTMRGIFAAGPNGSWRAIGDNRNGQLGIGSSASSREFRTITVGAPVQKVFLGSSHSCAVAQDNSVYCTGYNTRGQLGVGNKSRSESYQLVAGLKAKSVGLGQGFTCALDIENKVRCWGLKFDGQGDTSTPEPPVLSEVKELTVGDEHVCARVDLDGTIGLTCWGKNDQGQSLPGMPGPPVIAPGMPQTPFGTLTPRALYAGASTTCFEIARPPGGAIETYCWGNGAPYGSGPSQPIRQVLGGILSSSFAKNRLCYLQSNGIARCFSQPGVVALPNASEIAQFITSEDATCALSQPPGQPTLVQCWGANARGQLNGDPDANEMLNDAVAVDAGFPMGERAAYVAPGSQALCIVGDKGTLRCRGENGVGQIGLGKGFANPVAAVAAPGL
jgi:alpha-tubulin suppressor-like RCC1 family protein